MNKEILIELTNKIYRLTLLFPKKEPLRYKMRELADEILARCSKWNPEQKIDRGPSSVKITEVRPQEILDELEVLDGFFEVAKNQNWVPVVDVLRIQEEYNRIKAEIKKITKRPPEPLEKEIVESAEIKPLQSLQSVNSRQEKILEILKEKGRAQVWQVKQVFPEVSKRTLRRDFENLLKQGIIERIGERNDTFYQLKRSLAPLEVGQG